MTVTGRTILASLVAIASTVAGHASESSSTCDTLGAGLVVASVGPGSTGEIAGIEKGDVLISWRMLAASPVGPTGSDHHDRGEDGPRETAGTFDSAFDRAWAEWEQAPRAPLVLTIEREARTVEITVPDSAWVVEARPRFSDHCQDLFATAMGAIAGGNGDKAAHTARELAAILSSSGDHGNAAWVLYTTAKKLVPYAPEVMLEIYAEALSAARAADCAFCEGVILIGRGRDLWLTGDPEGAEKALIEALDACDQAHSPLFVESTAEERLGIVYEKTGRFEEAEQRYQRSMQLSEKYAPRSFSSVMQLRNMGSLSLLRGRLDDAESYYRRYLAGARKVSDANLDVAAALTGLGEVALDRGALDEAARLQREVADILATVSPDSIAVAHNLGNLGVIAMLKGELVDAVEYLRKCLETTQRLAPDSPDSASTLFYMGVAAHMMGDDEQALESLNASLAMFNRRLPNNLPVADVLASIGSVQADMGELATAETTLKRALAINSRLASGSRREADCYYRLGELRRRQGDIQGAVPLFLAAVDSLESQIDRLGGDQESRGRFVATYYQMYGALISSLAAVGRHAESFHALERSRAQLFRQALAERDLAFDTIPPRLNFERRQIATTYDAIQAQLGRISPESDHEMVDTLLAAMDDLRRQQQEIRQEVRRLSPRLADLRYPEPMGVDEVRASLDDGTVLLAYAVTEGTTELFVISGVSGSPQPFAAITLTGAGEQALEKDIGTFNEYIAAGLSETEESIRSTGHELYERLVAPAESWIEPADRIVICADGPLQRLPFAALTRTADGQEPRYLLEWKPLHQATSATVYAQLRMGGRRAASGSIPTTVAAFGDPIYPQPDDPHGTRVADLRLRSVAGWGQALQPLPASRLEAASVAEVWGQSAAAYLGADATEERVKRLTDVDIVHFACHAILDRRSPLDSALVLSVPDEVVGEHDNGLLQAWEIIEQVHLDSDLVVLSACDTALGADLRGEGMIGLTRAFQYAGARSVIASLWSVPDRSTALLMRRFHEHLHSGQSIDEALRQAQLSLLHPPDDEGDEAPGLGHHSHHPFFWAGFELYGDWR